MSEPRGWIRALLHEVFFTMPRRHMLVFLLATVLLILVEVEVIEGGGWHLVRVLEVLGFMLLLYMGWATWRVARTLTKQRRL